MKSVVITGASTGIGRATAEHLAAKGWTVFAGVRKKADGKVLTDAEPRIKPIILDVTKPEQIAAAVETVSAELGNEKLSGLVNNAGIADMGPLPVQSMDEIRWHFEVNVFGLIAMSQAFAPLLGMDESRTGESGRIVNISSVGGRVAAPFLGAYTATKHAVESVTDSFRRELMMFGIDAICVGPGAIKTPIWDKDAERMEADLYGNSPWAEAIRLFSKVFRDTGEQGFPASHVAEVIETALTHPKPKARYAPVPQKIRNFYLPTLLPKRLVDKGFANNFGMGPKSRAK
ncbi:MAG: SDR family oxidoreductase [Pseudomonadota bacterium]